MKVLAVTNMYPTPSAPTNGVFVEQQVKGMLSIGLQVRVVLIDRRQEGAVAYYRMAPKIRRAIADFEPDLIHVMYGGVMADRITRQKGLPPVIVTYHGSDLMGDNLSGLRRKLVSYYGIYCSKTAARRASGVVVVARHLIKRLPECVRQQKVRVIACGIDLERFKPLDQHSCQQQLGWASDRSHILFASNSGDPVKRPWLAQAAVEQLNKKGVRAELHYLSGVSYSDVPAWINASNVFLLTSLHEGSPTIVKEAIACGVPIVSVDVGDVAERIEGIEGCCLAKAEPEDLALKLRWVLEHGRTGHGRSSRPASPVSDSEEKPNGRACVESLSHVDAARQLYQFYEEILAGTQRQVFHQ
jgi:glycosyltransferase involved in cell wall biosynthesis